MKAQSIKIDGQEFPAFMSQDGLRIATPERAYILHPLCTEGGTPLVDGYGKRGQLPPGAPVEIRRRNFRAPYPDWTARYPEDTKYFWKLRQQYIANMTLERFQRKYRRTGGAQQGAARLEAWRKAQDNFEAWKIAAGIYDVFHRRATSKQIEDVEGPEILQLSICGWFNNHSGEEAGRILKMIEWEARYNDPERGVIYLRDLQAVPHNPDEAAWARSLQAAMSNNQSGSKTLPPAKKPRKRGRKRQYDPAADKRLLIGWRSGGFKRYEDYARARGMKTGDLVRALQRARAVERAKRRG